MQNNGRTQLLGIQGGNLINAETLRDFLMMGDLICRSPLVHPMLTPLKASIQEATSGKGFGSLARGPQQSNGFR